MEVRPIRTDADHAWALREIERLWSKAEPGTREGDRFEVLATLVDAYEREHHPVPPPDPVEAIRFRIEQQGLTTKDLLVVFKTTARMSEVLTRKRRLSLNMIRALNAQFAIPLECLVVAYKLRTGPARKRGVHASRPSPPRRSGREKTAR